MRVFTFVSFIYMEYGKHEEDVREQEKNYIYHDEYFYGIFCERCLHIFSLFSQTSGVFQILSEIQVVYNNFY